MPDDSAATPHADPVHHDAHAFATRLSHAGRAGKRVHGFVNPAVHRGSTVLYPDVAIRNGGFKKRLDQHLIYGTLGGPTHWPLEDVVAEIEGGTRCQIVSTGLAAITTPLLAFLKAGEHCLMPDNVYGPARAFAEGMMKDLGIETTFYDPCVDAAGIEPLFRPNTRVLYAESPGSHTFEVQDIPALAQVAQRHGARVLMDNTWGIHYFQPFAHGVHVSIQALTKYVVGHSDVLLGSITTNDPESWERVRLASMALGQYASPDDCWLALRGVRTMAVRLARQMESALNVAAWLRDQPDVAQVLYPALPGAPGHEIWKRDFSGASSLFGIELTAQHEQPAIEAMAEALELFGIGASWGGFESLVMPSNVTRTAGSGQFKGRLVRLHIGLEDPDDLKADLAHGLDVLRRHHNMPPQQSPAA